VEREEQAEAGIRANRRRSRFRLGMRRSIS